MWVKIDLAALAVINGAAVEIPADGHADHHGRRESVIRAPTQAGELVADLHHRRPDVIEELDFDDGLQSAGGHAGSAADDGGFGDGSIEDALRSKDGLEALGGLEHAALAFDLLQALLVAAIGDVLAEQHDLVVAPHLLVQGEIDGVDHGARIAGKARLGSNSLEVGSTRGEYRNRMAEPGGRRRGFQVRAGRSPGFRAPPRELTAPSRGLRASLGR